MWLFIEHSKAKDLKTLIEELKSSDAFVRERAAFEIYKMKLNDYHSIQALINVLRHENPYVRHEASVLLGGIGLPASKQLILALKDENANLKKEAASALYWMAMWEKVDVSGFELLLSIFKDLNPEIRKLIRRAVGMTAAFYYDDIRVSETMIAALKRKDHEIIAGAYEFFISLGESGSESVLIDALKWFGTKEMAEAFLNSSNEQLKKRALKWASDNGYTISSRGGYSTKWGGSKKKE